jgi:hypothetical protein
MILISARVVLASKKRAKLFHQEIVYYKLLFSLKERMARNTQKQRLASTGALPPAVQQAIGCLTDKLAASCLFFVHSSNTSTLSGECYKKLNFFNLSKKTRNGDVRTIFS